MPSDRRALWYELVAGRYESFDVARGHVLQVAAVRHKGIELPTPPRVFFLCQGLVDAVLTWPGLASKARGAQDAALTLEQKFTTSG